MRVHIGDGCIRRLWQRQGAQQGLVCLSDDALFLRARTADGTVIATAYQSAEGIWPITVAAEVVRAAGLPVGGLHGVVGYACSREVARAGLELLSNLYVAALR